MAEILAQEEKEILVQQLSSSYSSVPEKEWFLFKFHCPVLFLTSCQQLANILSAGTDQSRHCVYLACGFQQRAQVAFKDTKCDK